MQNFQVFVIHSTKPINQIKQCLEKCGGYTHVGIIYRSSKNRSHSGSTKEETNKTIVFCPESTVTHLKLEYPEFNEHVMDYNWSSFPLPNRDTGETWDLHISGVPNDYTSQQASDFVIKSLSCILPERSEDQVNFTVDFPSRLRETGEISGYGKIVFSDHIDHELIKHCKLVLHNTPLSFRNSSTKERRMISCIWHRDPESSHRIRHIRYEDSEMGTNRNRTEDFSSIQRARPGKIPRPDIGDANKRETVSNHD